MSRRIVKVSGFLGGALVAGALAFGMLVATAKPAHAFECADDGVWFLGSHPSASSCRNACVAIHGPSINDVWNPTTTCCKCLL
jgi:hypothetical protein